MTPNIRGGEGAWRVLDLLEKKSLGEELSEEQVAYLVRGISDASFVDDLQLGALLMAIKLRGMTKKEMVALTLSMRDSGTVLTWPKEWVTVDKHSTGGVGDKVSPALAPALAALGLKVPMISGRGLEHTGGTLDKLESIAGFRVSMSEDEMREALQEVGCCIVGQTKDIVPADCRMYAARDVSATVLSHPLIVSSITSKKAAESLKVFVLDAKFGKGAFMKTRKEAEKLANLIVEVGRGVGMATSAILTTMDAPVGRTIGNALEIREVLECLQGHGPPDLRELVVHLGGEVAFMSGVAGSEKEGLEAVKRVIDDGSARKVFCKMLQMQGVAASVAEGLCSENPDYTLLPSAIHVTQVIAPVTGVVTGLDAMVLAKVSLALGAGRGHAGDPINYAVGIVLLKVLGERVSEGEAWAELHHDSPLSKTILVNTQTALILDPSTEPFSVPSLVVTRV